MTEREWPYPLPPGTHVAVRVKKLDLSGDVDLVGTVVRALKVPPANTVSYAVKVVKDMQPYILQVLARNTLPIDTRTEEGLDLWLGAIEEQKFDPAELPGPDLAGQTPNGAVGLGNPTTTYAPITGSLTSSSTVTNFNTP